MTAMPTEEPVPPALPWLTAPGAACPLAALPGLWQRAEVVVVCRRRRLLEEAPNLVERIRGAWGRALMRRAEAAAGGRLDPWRRPTALAALMGEHGRHTRRLPVPKPYVLAADVAGGTVTVRLTLFGAARYWTAAAGAALAEGLAGGIAQRSGGAHRVSLEPEHRQERWHETVAVPAPGGAHGDRVELLLLSLTHRVRGLARWMHLDPQADWADLRRRIACLDIDDAGLGPVAWQRFTARQRGRAGLSRGAPDRAGLSRAAPRQPDGLRHGGALSFRRKPIDKIWKTSCHAAGRARGRSARSPCAGAGAPGSGRSCRSIFRPIRPPPPSGMPGPLPRRWPGSTPGATA